jgi:Spy/CpxP family protein refolding chaperone
MKLAIRIIALFVVVAGAAAATSSTTNVFVSHQSATASMPGPGCGPGMPCGPDEPPSN